MRCKVIKTASRPEAVGPQQRVMRPTGGNMCECRYKAREESYRNRLYLIFELNDGLLEDGLRCKVINTVSTVDIRRSGRNGEWYWREHV